MGTVEPSTDRVSYDYEDMLWNTALLMDSQGKRLYVLLPAEMWRILRWDLLKTHAYIVESGDMESFEYSGFMIRKGPEHCQPCMWVEGREDTMRLLQRERDSNTASTRGADFVVRRKK